MLLSQKTTIHWNTDQANIVGHMCYAAFKLWNVCNYERRNYRELGLVQFPDWYYQKSHHKADIWYRSLPSQTAQEICKQLDKSWKSYFALVKSKGIVNPHPPRFKQEKMAITYMQNGIVHAPGDSRVRLSLPKKLKEYMQAVYGIRDNYLYLENVIFRNTDSIKQIKVYPPDSHGESRLIVIYQVEDKEILWDNGHYLSIDLGLHNLVTAYDSEGRSFIVGRKYLNIAHRYDKEIARVQSQWGRCQASRGVKFPKISNHLRRLYQKKQNSIRDYLHKVTRYLVDYCVSREIHTVVIGDITNIRKENDLGSKVNQQLHGLPYRKLYGLLEYKLAQKGIRLVRQEESYSSQCAPDTALVAKEYAVKSNRRKRGLYQNGSKIYNADTVGAYNILRKYMAVSGIETKLDRRGLCSTSVVRAA